MEALTESRYAQVRDFLYHEAELLDDRRLHEWLELLAPEIDYRIPTRVTRERGGASEFSEASYLMIEDLGSLTTRVRRFDTDFAFSEDPPTRTRRVVGNIRATGGPSPQEVAVKSNLLLFRAKRDLPGVLVAGERHDVLQLAGDRLLLRKRLVLLDHTVLPMENLAVFL